MFKAQYKTAPNMQWQTKQVGSEVSCMATYLRLKESYPFARVVDNSGRIIS